MSNKSNIQGRAYEYAFLMSLFERIGEFRPVNILDNASLKVCASAWENLQQEDKNLYKVSSLAAIDNLFQLEPYIIDNPGDTVELKIQPDSAGEEGDVRDILIIRDAVRWEIGLSLKHNNFAVKHSRLASNLDFAESWFGVPCSKTYWDEISPVFDYLESERKKNSLFRDIADKEGRVYVPILEAFMHEMNRLFSKCRDIPSKLVEYLLGRYDFYKIISVDSQKYTSIQAVNIHGTLNKATPMLSSPFDIPVVKLPTRLVHIGFVPGSKTTLELYMDEGWQFTFRIHNASSKVEPSLKFDIRIVGMPTAVITINCRWNESN